MIEKDPIKIMMKPSTGGGVSGFHMKAILDGGGNGGYRVKRAGSVRKLHDCAYCFYVYPDGSIEVTKNRWEDVKGNVEIEQVIPIFSKCIADLQLKDTAELKLFKEGLSELLQESINNTLKGDYYERAIRAESAGHGLDSNRSP